MIKTSPRANGIRKAAVFVSSLDRAAADLVLEQMSPQQAQAVRQAMVGLGEVASEEQHRVLDEFRRLEPLTPGKNPPGIELDDSLAQALARPPERRSGDSEEWRPADVPFRFLREAETEKLAKILVAERPQVIALVLSHLAPEQAGKVLARLAPATQVDVVRRLVDLEETDPEILHDVERGLEKRLSELVRMQRRRVAGLSAVAGILEASEQQIGMQLLDNLAQHDHALADRLMPEPFEFTDLLAFDDRTLAKVLAAAELELVILALVGAPPEWSARLVRLLAEPEARQVNRALGSPGPTRLSDVEEARSRLAELAGQMAIQGRIELPRRQRLPATV
jgi:flagellar motor switch protein FliG